jgi:hypothetical protein
LKGFQSCVTHPQWDKGIPFIRVISFPVTGTDISGIDGFHNLGLYRGSIFASDEMGIRAGGRERDIEINIYPFS